MTAIPSGVICTAIESPPETSFAPQIQRWFSGRRWAASRLATVPAGDELVKFQEPPFRPRAATPPLTCSTGRRRDDTLCSRCANVTAPLHKTPFAKTRPTRRASGLVQPCAAANRSVRHGTCYRRHLSARHAGAAPHSAAAELEVVRRSYASPATEIYNYKHENIHSASTFCFDPIFLFVGESGSIRDHNRRGAFPRG